MTSQDGGPAAQARAVSEAAGWLSGAAEGLSVLSGRRPAVQRRAGEYAVSLLTAHAWPADWQSAGLPAPALPAPATALPAPALAEPAQGSSVPLWHRAVVRLARTAMQLYLRGLPSVQRPPRWADMRQFFGGVTGAPCQDLQRLEEYWLTSRVQAGDAPAQVVDGLQRALRTHNELDGDDAYLTGLARTNLAFAYRIRGHGQDLARAVTLTERESRARAARYGASHPVTLVARSLHARALLSLAHAAADTSSRHRFAEAALAEVNEVRAARDRVFGSTSEMAIRSRRHEGHALLLLDQPDRARDCLELTLAMETERYGGPTGQDSGLTVLYLARAHLALGNRELAAQLAAEAASRLSSDSPDGPGHRAARSLLAQLSAGG
ncbi:MAG TPA: hypothetical protein VEL03_12070 [Streptosporangiaceae bacterium]|nr:hypothetical protein [Streptosporangiaceae bacterium]